MAVPLPPLDVLISGIQRQARLAGGRFSVAACSTTNGCGAVSLAGDEVYPAASVIKVPVLAALYAARDEGRLTLEDTAVLTAADKVGGSGVLLELHDGLQLTLRDLAHLMIVVSDNTATNMLIDAVGQLYIEEFLKRHGFRDIRLERRLFDLEARSRGRDNWISANEMVRLFAMLHRGEISPLTDASCAECLEILRRQQHTEKIPALLPKTARVANKPGGLDDVTHDAGLVEPAAGVPYAIAILCADFPALRPAQTAVAKVSRLVYDYFAGPLQSAE